MFKTFPGNAGGVGQSRIEGSEKGYMVGSFVLLSGFERVATGYRADAVDFILKVRAVVPLLDR